MPAAPHVVILMADQLRWDALGEHTPVINGLVDRSFLFRRAYCASPLCVPARGAFFTGLYPNQTGSIINPWDPSDAGHGDVRAGTANLYTMMEDRWDSRHCGKQHLYTAERIDDSPDTRTRWVTMKRDYRDHLAATGHRAPGGERFRGMIPEMVGGRITRMKRYSIPATGLYEPGLESFYDGFIATRAVEAIRERDRTRPLLLNTMFVAPHPPYDIPDPWHSMIGQARLPRNVGRWYPDQSPLQLYNLTGAIGVRYTREDWQKIWPVYLGLVALLDHCVGMILEELEAQGIYDDALILFCADHGEMLGSHCLFQKMCMYQESVLTPLAFKLPAGMDIRPGVSDQLASAVDVLPTICELAGVQTPEGLAGRSLVPAMRGGTLGRDHAFIQFDGNGARGNFQRAMVRGRHKLIVKSGQSNVQSVFAGALGD